MLTQANVVGLDEGHLCSADDAKRLTVSVHRDVVEPFRKLHDAAAADGFDLAILSGFRSFEKQLSIWNRKARGELPVLDADSMPIDITTLSERELAFSILRWSALPGASRHHWGTDLDVYDAAARPAGYEIQLVPSEYADGGIFAPLSKWLDARIADNSAFGFFRPYDEDRGGVAAERWHLSYAPVAATYIWNLTPDLLRQTIEAADMMLKDVVLANLDEIITWFVNNTNTDAP